MDMVAKRDMDICRPKDPAQTLVETILLWSVSSLVAVGSC
jgi:hypothetical protein